MKGVLMKVGQLVSFIAEGLPDEAQAALAALQADAAPMSPTLAAEVVAGRARRTSPSRCSGAGTTSPSPPPASARSTAPRPSDRREVAVKVQFPGVGEAIEEDLDGAEVMYSVFSALALNGLDARGLVDELRARMREELDYRLEARNIAEFAHHFAGHPWVRIPELVPELSREPRADDRVDRRDVVGPVRRPPRSPETKQRAGEVIWRFGQHSIQRLGAFNGDPHPGNYRFHHDGSVTFLDFGLVKRWDARRVGAPRAEPRRHRRAPRPGAARRGDGAGRLPRRGPRARSRSWSTTTCRARTGRTSSTSSRSPATGCATRSAASSTSTVRTPR